MLQQLRVLFSRGWPLPLVVLCIGASAGYTQSLPADKAPVVEDIFPPLGPVIPRLRFHTGAVKDNQPEISPILPDIPGAPSPWYVAQWGQHQFLAGNEMSRDDPLTHDRRLGNAVFAFTTPDRHSHVWIYKSALDRAPVYELYEKDGELRAGGGSNIFLTANAPQDGVSLDKEIDYRLDARITKATVKYATPTAKASGAVLAGIFTGFTIQFPDPQSGQTSTLFLQIPHGSSRDVNSADYRSCSVSNGRRTIIYGSDLPGDRRLAFRPDAGPMTHLNYSIDRYVCDLITRPLTCTTPNGPTSSITLLDGIKDFGEWKLKGMYVGLETEAKDLRPQSHNTELQGSVSVALQLSALHVLRHLDRSFTPGDCATQYGSSH